MNCAFDKEKLTGYYDGELEAAEKAEVERHIASCSECLRELGELKSAAILVKDLPRLRAPKSIAEGVSREIQTTGKVHQFAKMRRTILWASAAAAALFVGLNVMYFSAAPKSAPVAREAASPPPVAKIQQEHPEEAQKAGEKESEKGPARRLASADRAADESKFRSETRKAVEEKEQLREDARKAPETAPVERARDKDKSDALAKGAEPKAAAAEPPVPAKPMAAPPGAAPAPVAKQSAAPPPAAEVEKAATKEALARSENKKAPADPAAEAAPTHLTLASTQVSKSRIEMEAALKKMGVAMSPPAPTVKNMKAAPTAETTLSLELTDSQIARLQRELNKPGASRLLLAAPGDPVLAEFRDGRMLGRKENGASVAGGAAAKELKSKEFGKADAKAESSKDGKEGKEADAVTRGQGEPAADKSAEPRRKVVLHLVEVPYVPDAQAAPDALKK